MSSNHASLDAASSDRKARLAKLSSLKRKQPHVNTPLPNAEDDETPSEETSASDTHISGRNYDVSTKGPKLGFENVPSTKVNTLEQQADRIAVSAAEQAAKDQEEVEKGIDLFKLQPKKPNWDLKRDLAEKMKVMDVRTRNAIALLVRQRIENAKEEALRKAKNGNGGQDTEHGEEVGIDGSTLLEGVHLREREEDESRNSEGEIEEDLR